MVKVDQNSINILSNLTFGQILVLFSIALGMAAIVVLIVLFKVPLKLKTKKGNIFSNTQDKQKEDSLKEKMVIQKRDLLVVMGRISEIVKKEVELKKVDTLNSQMSFVEEKISEIRNVLETRFLELLREKIPPDKLAIIIYNTDYQKYNLVIKGALDKITNSFRLACRANHFDEYDDDKFLSYADRKANQYITIITDAINDGYISSIDITFDQITKDNMINTFPRVKEIFVRFFTNAKRIAGETNDKIIEMDFELMDFIENYIGVEISQEEKQIFIKSISKEKERILKKRMLERR